MQRPGPRSRRSVLRISLLVLAPLLACDIAGLPFPPITSRPAGRDFASAPLLELEPDGTARFSGNVGLGRADVWDLGPVEPGDRVILTVVAAVGSLLDPTAALFDADEDLFAVNDDVDLRAGRLDSKIDQRVRAASDRFYLAITASFFSSQSGDYVADLKIIRGGDAPQPARQKLLLNFAGGDNVDIRNVGVFNIAPFNAANIDDAYADQTATIKAGIIATVRDNLAPFDVLILTSDDGTPAEGPDYSTLYFGAFSRTTFGISEQVDIWNADICDDGIIYTDRFDDPFAVRPTAAQIAVAIGNVAAHEAGHLLGLSHVADVTDLMDTTGAASTLLADQEFKRSPLDRSIFPFGFQDGPKILLLTVGEAP